MNQPPNAALGRANSNPVLDPAIILSDSNPIKLVNNYYAIVKILTDIFETSAGHTLAFGEIWKSIQAAGHDRTYTTINVLDILFKDTELFNAVYTIENKKRVLHFTKRENVVNVIRWKGPPISLQEACYKRDVTPKLHSILQQQTLPAEYRMPKFLDTENRTLHNLDDFKQFNFLKSHVLHFNPTNGETKFVPYEVGSTEQLESSSERRQNDRVARTLHYNIYCLLINAPDKKMFYLDILSAMEGRFPEMPSEKRRPNVNYTIRKYKCLAKVGRNPVKGDIIQHQWCRFLGSPKPSPTKTTVPAAATQLPTGTMEAEPSSSTSVSMSDIRRRFSKRQQFLDSLEEPDPEDLYATPSENALQDASPSQRFSCPAPPQFTSVITSSQLSSKQTQFRSPQNNGLMRNGAHPINGNMANFQRSGPTHAPNTIVSKKNPRTLRAIERETRENKQYEHFRTYLAGQPRITVESAVRSRLVPKALMCRSYQHPFDTSSLEPYQKEFLQNYSLQYNQEHGTFEFTIRTSDRSGQKRKTPPMIPEIRVSAPEEEPASAKIYRPEPIHPVITQNFDARHFLHPQFNMRAPTSSLGCLPQNIVDLSRLVFQAQQVQAQQFPSSCPTQLQSRPKSGFTIPELISQSTSRDIQNSKF